MHLLFDARVLTHTHYTGVENYTKEILNQLLKSLHVKVAKPSFTNKYLSHLYLHVRFPFQKGDLLFCPANLAPIFVPKSKKLVITLHDVAFLTQKESFSKIFQSYYQFLVPKNIKRADTIITVSEASKKEIEKYYPLAKGKVEVISLGVNTNLKHLKLDKKDQVLYVGSINKRKNFIGVLEAFMNVSLQTTKLMIVGNMVGNFSLDEETLKILDKAKQHKNIIFKSNVSNDELLTLYNESKLFIYPSFYEGFGLPPLEAMACGTPVITSNVSSLPEVGGDAVLYCDPYDINDIQGKIEMLLNNEKLQNTLSQKGLLRAKLFSWEKAAQQHIEVFNKVLQR